MQSFTKWFVVFNTFLLMLSSGLRLNLTYVSQLGNKSAEFAKLYKIHHWKTEINEYTIFSVYAALAQMGNWLLNPDYDYNAAFEVY